jgi:hypothetical protein
MVRSLTIILSIIGATSIQAQIDDHLQERPTIDDYLRERPTGPTIENAPYEGYGEEHRMDNPPETDDRTNPAEDLPERPIEPPDVTPP